jgi:ABC-type multidrug transport system permease subunit
MKRLLNSQLYRLSLSHLLEILREPETLFWGMIFPALISTGLGLAFSQPNEAKFRVAIVEQQPTELDSILAIHAVTEDDKQLWRLNDATLGDTEFRFQRLTWEEAIVSVKRGETDLIVTDSCGRAHFRFDPANQQSQLAFLRLTACVAAPDIQASQKTYIFSPMTLKGVRYIDFLIPGLIAFGLMSSIMWGISYTIIEKRSQKLLRRLVATPMKKTCFLVSLMLVRIIMNYIEALILFGFAWMFFDIEIQGSTGALLLLFAAGCLCFTGIAVLISCHTAKTEVGTGWINAVQMPMMLLSGVFFSYHNFPEWAIGAIRLLPLTALADAIRSIFNEGVGWLEVLQPSIMLSAIGIVCFSIGMKFFKWY